MSTNATNGNSINWDESIKEYKESGMSIKNYCEMRNIPQSRFKYHLYKGRYDKKNLAINDNVSLIKVVPAKQEKEKCTIDINIGKASITVDDSTNLQLLAKVMEVLS